MRRFRRRKKINFIAPFLWLIGVGLIGFAGIYFWNSFWTVQKGDAVFYLVEGRAKLLPFGNQEWENLFNGVRVKLGDSVKVMSGGRGVIKFYDGTVARLDENTEVNLVDITKNDENQQILLKLNNGQAWVNKPKKASLIKKTDFMINTDAASYSITGTIFNLQRDLNAEILRVLNGEVSVGILEEQEGKLKTIAELPVGIGQESFIDKAVVKAFLDRQNPSVKRAIDASFNETEWFIWNTEEDENPTDYTNPGAKKPIKPVETPIIKDDQATTDVSAKPDSDTANDQVVNGDKDEDITENKDITAPKILTLGGKPYQEGMTVTKEPVAITGEIANADAVFANNYQLSKFKTGDKTWSYNLAEKFGNLKSGPNQIEVYGTTVGGKKSPVTVLIFNYQPGS